MKGFTPDSSNIGSVTYDAATRTMTVEFRSGGTYRYTGVPEDTYDAFTRASSAGQFFHRHIKSAHAGERV